MESTDLNSSNEFHYIRPTANEVMKAKEDPLRPYCASNQEDMDGRAYSTMVLRPKPDAPLEAEKNSSYGDKYVKMHFHFSFKVSKVAKIRNRYNQVPHLGKVTNSQKTPQTRAKRSALSQQVTTKHI